MSCIINNVNSHNESLFDPLFLSAGKDKTTKAQEIANKTLKSPHSVSFYEYNLKRSGITGLLNQEFTRPRSVAEFAEAIAYDRAKQSHDIPKLIDYIAGQLEKGIDLRINGTCYGARGRGGMKELLRLISKELGIDCKSRNQLVEHLKKMDSTYQRSISFFLTHLQQSVAANSLCFVREKIARECPNRELGNLEKSLSIDIEMAGINPALLSTITITNRGQIVQKQGRSVPIPIEIKTRITDLEKATLSIELDPNE